MQDAWRAYLELALGLTEAPRKKAQDAVRRVVGQGGATAAQLQALAEELLSTGAENREALTKLVRFEVDRALGAVGLASAEEVADLTRRVHELERQLRDAKAGAAAGGEQHPGTVEQAQPGPGERAAAAESSGAPVAAPPARPAPLPTGTPAKKAVAKKAVAKKAIAKKPPATVSRTATAESPGTPARKATGRRRTGATGPGGGTQQAGDAGQAGGTEQTGGAGS